MKNECPKRVPLDEEKLMDASRRFAGRLFAWRPSLVSNAYMEQRKDSDRCDLVVEIPSPTGDQHRLVLIWMEDDVGPSVCFGPWHTHADVEAGEIQLQTGLSVDPEFAIIDLLDAILADRFVLYGDISGADDEIRERPVPLRAWGVLDLRDPHAIPEELTHPYSPPDRLCIKSWSGSGDRQVGLEDINR